VVIIEIIAGGGGGGALMINEAEDGNDGQAQASIPGTTGFSYFQYKSEGS